MEISNIDELFYRVRLYLLPSQKSHDTYVVTMNGQERVVEHPIVQWYCNTIEEAVDSFRPEEVEKFEISGPGIPVPLIKTVQE